MPMTMPQPGLPPNYCSDKARCWNSDHPAFSMMIQEAKEKLAQDPDWYAKGRG